MIYKMQSTSPVFNYPPSDLYINARNSNGTIIRFPVGDNIQNGNTLLVGTTRTGKTCFVRAMAKKLRRCYPDALFLFLDVKRDYLPLYQEGDRIFSFYSGESFRYFQWNLLEECLESQNPRDELREIVEIMFEKQPEQSQKFFTDAAKEVFIAYCATFLSQINPASKYIPTNAEIIQLLQGMSFQQLRTRILMDKNNQMLCNSLLPATEKGLPTRQAEGVMGVLRNFLPLFSGNFCSNGHDTASSFLTESGNAIFLEYDYSRQRSSSLFFRLFLKLIIRKKLSNYENKKKKVYLILDEAATLSGDFDLMNALNVGAGNGLRILFACQTINHLYAVAPIYQNERMGMAGLAGFANLISFRPNDKDTLEMVQKQFGETSISCLSMGISRSQSSIVQIQKDFLVPSLELMSLNVGEAYVKIKGSTPQKLYFPEED